MHNKNLSRLWQMADLRRNRPQASLLPSKPAPFWNEPCIQCGDQAITKHTDLVSGDVSFWCSDDWDHWWTCVTVQQMRRSGQIQHIAEAIIPQSSFDEQLTGWPQ